MSHECFKHIGHPLDKAQEECAELISAISKVKRFGLVNGAYDNSAKVMSEICDVRETIAEVESWIKSELKQ